MGFQLICKTTFFVLLLAGVLVEDTSAKSVYDHIQGFLGYETKISNDSCLGTEAFADPDAATSFYQCFWNDDGEFWDIVHLECPPGGYFNQEYGVTPVGVMAISAFDEGRTGKFIENEPVAHHTANHTSKSRKSSEPHRTTPGVVRGVVRCASFALQ
ncbi:hypothetical protein Fcan01_24040 [Folsomia candida]|uniref:Uncharacterized protein n=1 Tax=Folsomia candida TaxID=158441 RepID=A0A226D7M2_FOLCA|nr:hypothetical protein Fcan01_24040 [Folsomia candida]